MSALCVGLEGIPTTSAVRKKGVAHVALTESNQSIKNSNFMQIIANLTEPDISDTNLLITENQRTLLYGQSIAARIKQPGKNHEVRMVEGVSYECYMTFLHMHFPECKVVQEAWESMMETGLTRYDLLEVIDDNIELTYGDALKMRDLDREADQQEIPMLSPEAQRRL
jgi:hypothetical protein